MATVLVTGSNRGIGLEIVKLLVERGDTVFAACRSAGDELPGVGARVIDNVDVASERVGAVLNDSLGDTKLDTVVLNAGVLRADSLDNLDYDAMRTQFEVNTLGPLRVADALRGRLGEGGRIAIITSRMGSLEDNTSGGMYGYRVSKAGVNMVGRSLANDLRDRGVAVQLLHPGYVQTDMTGGRGHITPPESAAGLVARIDEISLDTTGTFFHQNGEPLPW